MKEIELSWFNPITNYGKLILWTQLPIPNCKLDRVPGVYIEVKQLF